MRENIWTQARDGRDLFARVRALPGFGEQRPKIQWPAGQATFGVKPAGWTTVTGDYGKGFRSVADVTDPDSLQKVRDFRRRQGRGQGRHVVIGGPPPPTHARDRFFVGRFAQAVRTARTSWPRVWCYGSQSSTAPRSLIELSRSVLEVTITGVALTATESAVNIACITADSVQNEINHTLGVEGSDELGAARTPAFALMAQLADLLGPDRPFGRILGAGGPLERIPGARRRGRQARRPGRSP